MTYLDDEMRISKGDRGNLFVLGASRAGQMKIMLLLHRLPASFWEAYMVLHSPNRNSKKSGPACVKSLGQTCYNAELRTLFQA
jgi:hypothetical protein